MKAILVIDMPETCSKCELHGKDMEGIYCEVCSEKDYIKEYKGIPSWCPLKPLPTKKKPLFDPDHCEIEKEIKIVHEIIGYNRCIDEIMGETDGWRKENETVKSA